jgi:hypothetical protein
MNMPGYAMGNRGQGWVGPRAKLGERKQRRGFIRAREWERAREKQHRCIFCQI